MSLRNTSDRFGVLAKSFHWLTFLLLLGSFGLGLTMVDLPLSPRKLEVYSWHKWVGVTVFLVTALRLCWRLANPAPPLPETMPRYQRFFAHLSHATLYALLIGMPIVGWTMSSALGLPTVYLGLVPLPDLVAPDRELGDFLRHVHHSGATALLVLIAIHVLAALQHHFLRKDDVLMRMWPWSIRGRYDT